MPVQDTEMLKSVIDSMPNMTSASSQQTLSDWLKNPGMMFQNNDNTNFLNTLSTFTLDRIRTEDFRNRLEDLGIVQRYQQGYGNLQRLYVKPQPPVDADFQKTWVNGESSDMWKKRLLTPTQKFAKSNISYNDRISVPGAGFYTTVFGDYDGLVAWQTAVNQSMMTTYSKWRFALEMDVIGRQTTASNLKANQEMTVSVADMYAPTAEEATNFAKAISRIKAAAAWDAGSMNEDGFSYQCDAADIKVLVPLGVKDAMLFALQNTYNPELTRTVIDTVQEVPYIGVPAYYQDSTKATALYPVYNSDGMITGLNTAQDGSGTAVSLTEAYCEAADASTLAMVIDRRRINYVTAVAADGRPTELITEWTIWNLEGRYRNYYLQVVGDPSQGAGARLFADSSYLLVNIKNGAAA